jgi:hypothetical protein
MICQQKIAELVIAKNVFTTKDAKSTKFRRGAGFKPAFLYALRNVYYYA